MDVEVMAMAMPVVAVASEVAMTVASEVTVAVAVAVAMTVPPGQSLARDGQRGSGQRQSCDRGRSDRLHLNHGSLLVKQRGDRPAMVQPRGAQFDMM